MLKFIVRNKAELLVIGANLIICLLIIYLIFNEVCDPFIEENSQLTPALQALLEELEKKYK